MIKKRYNSKQNDSNNTPIFSYYNYGKQGHIKIECPNINKEKKKVVDKKRRRSPWKDVPT